MTTIWIQIRTTAVVLAAALGLQGCAPSAAQGLWSRVESGDLSGRQALLELAPSLTGKQAIWVGLALDPDATPFRVGTDAMLAAKYYREATSSGEPSAGFNLLMLANRNPQVTLDTGEAERLLAEAADSNCFPALVLMALKLKESNPPRAADLLERAIRQEKHSVPERELGLMYLDGIGRDRDIDRGLALITSAASRGDLVAATTLASRARSPETKARWLGVSAAIRPSLTPQFKAALAQLHKQSAVEVMQAIDVWRQAYSQELPERDLTRPWVP